MAAAGSALADAAEFTALKEVFQNYSKQQYPIGTLKPNIGHLESASAMAQLSKIILQFKYNKIAPSLILGNINPFIHLDESPFYIPSKPIDLNNQKKQFNANHPQRALLNCYAGTGIYSSMIIENYPEQKFISPEQNFYLLPLSASTQEQLQEYAKKMLVFLENKDDYPLSDIAFSLQYGRQSMEKKVIFCCYNSKDFLYKLRVFFQTQENNSIRGIYHQKSSHSEILIQLGEDLASKVTLWLKGELNDWQQVEPYSNKQRLSLPTYPFIKESFWLFE